MSKTQQETKQEILTEIRNIVRYREDLLQPTDSLNYEDHQKKIIAFAGAVYHFKERLASWIKKSGLRVEPSIKEIAEATVPLLVCGDLFNYKKHGGCENRSNLSPFLSGMKMTPGTSPIGIQYNGQMKTGSVDRAVPFTIEIYCAENRTLGNAVRFIAKAFSTWIPVLEKTNLLNTCDKVEATLLGRLADFATDAP